MKKTILQLSSEYVIRHILIESNDMQDIMFATERLYQEYTTPKMRGDNPVIKQTLLFNVYGETTFIGYDNTHKEQEFKTTLISPEYYDNDDCRIYSQR